MGEHEIGQRIAIRLAAAKAGVAEIGPQPTPLPREARPVAFLECDVAGRDGEIARIVVALVAAPEQRHRLIARGPVAEQYLEHPVIAQRSRIIRAAFGIPGFDALECLLRRLASQLGSVGGPIQVVRGASLGDGLAEDFPGLRILAGQESIEHESARGSRALVAAIIGPRPLARRLEIAAEPLDLFTTIKRIAGSGPERRAKLEQRNGLLDVAEIKQLLCRLPCLITGNDLIVPAATKRRIAQVQIARLCSLTLLEQRACQ